MEPDVDIVLPTRNMEADIGSLLESIYAQDYSGSINIVVLDSSDDNTPEIAKSYGVKFARVHPSDYNYGATRNYGASLCSSEIVVFISADVELVDDQWLRQLTRWFDDFRVAGVFGRQAPKPSATPMEKHFISYTYGTKPRIADGQCKTDLSTNDIFFSNTNSAIRRNIWEQYKLPEMLKSEDHEWAKRVILAGYRVVYDPEAYVGHSHRYNLVSVFREYFDSGASFSHIHQDSHISNRRFHLLRDGSRYLVSELRFLLSNDHARWIPYALCYDFIKFLGLAIGGRYRWLPKRLVAKLCKKSDYWDRYLSAAGPAREHHYQVDEAT